MWLVKKKSLYICVEVLEPIVMMLAEVEQIYPMSKLIDIQYKSTERHKRKTQKSDLWNDKAIKGEP